jgi:hypothetical protein
MLIPTLENLTELAELEFSEDTRVSFRPEPIPYDLLLDLIDQRVAIGRLGEIRLDALNASDLTGYKAAQQEIATIEHELKVAQLAAQN